MVNELRTIRQTVVWKIRPAAIFRWCQGTQQRQTGFPSSTFGFRIVRCLCRSAAAKLCHLSESVSQYYIFFFAVELGDGELCPVQDEIAQLHRRLHGQT
jgi:hypothetical protein